MDLPSIGGILGVASMVIHIIEKVYMAVNHKRVRSRCCGYNTEVSLDVDNTTPPGEKALLKSPIGSLNPPKIALTK